MAYRPSNKVYTVIWRNFGDAHTFRDPRPFDASYKALDARDKLFQSDGDIQCAWVEVCAAGSSKRERYGQVVKRHERPYQRGDWLKEIEKA